MFSNEMTWQIDEYMVYYRSKQLREKTMASYEQALHLFERWCKEEMQIDDITKVTEGVIRRYLNDLQTRGKYTVCYNDRTIEVNYPNRRRDFRQPVSVTTINNYIRNLRAFFNWLERSCILQKNPMERIRQLKNSRQPKEYITDEDFRKLTSILDKSYFSEHRDYAMIVLMLDSGMRLGECSKLTSGDIHLSKRSITLRVEITKGRRDRTVYFSPWTERVMRRWLQFKDRYVESEYLFPVKSSGMSLKTSNFEANFKGYLKRAGLKETITPHCLRNNFAKRCLMNGMDIYTLSKLLGHSSVTVTEQAYLDLTAEDIGKRYQSYSPIATMR